MKTLQRVAIIVCAAAVVAVAAAAAGWALFEHFKVPYRGREVAASSPIWRGDGYPEIQADARILRLVERAKRDFFLAPIPLLPRYALIFKGVRARGREVYLFFTPDVPESVVVYCATPDDGRLHWKMDLTLDR